MSEGVGEQATQSVATNGVAVRCDAWMGSGRKCGAEMRPGVALLSTLTGEPDELGGDVVTLNYGGPGRLVACLKCVSCGHSRLPID